MNTNKLLVLSLVVNLQTIAGVLVMLENFPSTEQHEWVNIFNMLSNTIAETLNDPEVEKVLKELGLA